jgi:hypothetical protein
MSAKKSTKSKKRVKENNDVKDESNTSEKSGEMRESSSFSFKLSYLIVFVVVLALLVLLIFFLSSDDQTDSYEVYNGYEFIRHPQFENVWITTVNVNGFEQPYEFRYHPLDLEVFEYDSDINQYLFLTQRVNGEVSLALSGEVLNMGSGYVGLAGYDLARILRTYHGLDVVVFAENLEEYDWITCDEADINNLVIEFRRGVAGIELVAPFCVVVSFEDPEDSLRLSSLMIYNLMGIMD